MGQLTGLLVAVSGDAVSPVLNHRHPPINDLHLQKISGEITLLTLYRLMHVVRRVVGNCYECSFIGTLMHFLTLRIAESP